MGEDTQRHFRAIRKTKASREIVAQIRDMIAGGHMQAGDRLPSERKLAQIFGVGRSTLREAVRVLESLGLVDVRPGEGMFLTKSESPPEHGHLPSELFSKWTTQLNLFELRTVLEPGLAGLAARRATSDHLAKMQEVLEAQAAQVQRGASGRDEDVIFHRLIAEATGNPAVVQVMDTLTQVLQETRHASLQRNGRPARSLSQNRAILAAIEARNAALATRRMQAHIRSLKQVLFATGLQLAEVQHPIRDGGNGLHPSRGL